MTIKTKVTLSEYIKLIFFLNYRKPGRIFATFAGILFLTCPIFYYSGISIFNTFPVFQFFLGVMIVFVIPISTYTMSKKAFLSNLRLQEEIEYEFTIDKVKMTGETFVSEREWNKTYKVEKLKNWVLIYENARIFNLVPLKDISSEEIDNLTGILSSLKSVKVKI